MSLSARLVLRVIIRDRSRLRAVSQKNNKSFIGQAFSANMVGFWPHSFFCVFIDLDSISIHKHAKKNLVNIQQS